MMMSWRVRGCCEWLQKVKRKGKSRVIAGNLSAEKEKKKRKKEIGAEK
jgi:hypothetical protein